MPAASIPAGYVLPPATAIWCPITIGVILSIFGLGILLTQTIQYFDSSPTSDSRPLKSVILGVLLLNIAQTVSDCSRMMKLNVYNPGDIIYFLDLHARPEELLSPALSLIICTTAQLFLLRRCIIFARVASTSLKRRDGWRMWVRVGWRIALFLGVVLSFTFGLIVVIALGRMRSLMEANRKLHLESLMARMSTPWLVCTTLADVLLSATLLWELWRATTNQETTFKGKRALRAMIRVAWSNGVLVGALQLISLICLVTESSSWSDFPQIFISKVYSITLLSSITSPLSALRRGDRHAAPRPIAAELPGGNDLIPVPLPMLFKHKNPSVEWSPGPDPNDLGNGMGMGVGLQPYPLRNAECTSAQDARGEGRARLPSLTSTSGSSWHGHGHGNGYTTSTGAVASTPEKEKGTYSPDLHMDHKTGSGFDLLPSPTYTYHTPHGRPASGSTHGSPGSPVNIRLSPSNRFHQRFEPDRRDVLGTNTFGQGSTGQSVGGTKTFGSVGGEV